MRILLALPLIVGAILAIPPGSRAESGIELIAEGYVVLQRTSVNGVFQGCEKRLAIQFANGTVFDCDERNHHVAYRPAAWLFKNVRRQAYALLIDGRAYKGNIPQLTGKRLAVPLRVDLPQVAAEGPDPAVLPGLGLPKFAKAPEQAKFGTQIPLHAAGQATTPPGQ